MPLYDEYYKQIARKFNEIRLDQSEEIALTTKVIKKYASSESGILLDLGCGTGRYAESLKTAGYNVIGLDKSFDQLSYFSMDSKERVCATSTTLPFKEFSFSCCICILMLHQLDGDERKEALREVHRVLGLNGILLIKTCTHDDLRRRLFNDVFPTGLSINLERYPDIEPLMQDIDNLGFENVEQVKTVSIQTLAKSKFLHSIKNKHSTTMALIPPDEFDSGYHVLERELQNMAYIQVSHHYTTFVAKKLA